MPPFTVRLRLTMKLAAAAIFLSVVGASIATQVATRAPDAITPDGGRYYGQLADGKLHARGRIEWENGARYEGNFKQGLFSGKGSYRSSAGVTYEGEFKNGAMHGQGRYTGTDGSVYQGQFVKDGFEGRGSYRQRDGSVHVGMFRDWVPQGPGSYTDSDGNTFEGNFADGELTGKGRVKGKDGSSYEGELSAWRFHGHGVYRHANGDVYKGGFEFGKFEGEGVMSYATPREDGRTKDSGSWRYGSLEDPALDKLTRANVEAALYNQRALLDQSFAALLPGQPGKVDLYLLAVGGDGSQEVFRRETDFVRTQFDRDFGTAGRSLALVNSRSTVEKQPMATVTSIRASLAAIAARMNRDSDILFLYLTSHGSRDHQLSLGQNGMALQNLPAAELGRLLKESGIRWKVVVVSACYSGGFIAPLKDEQTMVITAARHDRTSFGCADENDFTYFGKAFFRDALPGSASFGEAFRKASALVARREAQDFKASEREADDKHSEPQIHHPAPIERQLGKWQAQLKAARPAGAVRQALLNLK